MAQRKELGRLLEGVVGRAFTETGLSKEDLRFLFTSTRFNEAIKKLLDDYSANKPSDTLRGYVSEVEGQVSTLRHHFPHLGTADVSIADHPLPDDAGGCGWFAIPRHEAIATEYCEAVRSVFECLKKQEDFRGGFRYDDGCIEKLRQTRDAERAWQRLGEEQNGRDILVVPMDLEFNCLFYGETWIEPTYNVEEEFDIGLFALGVILITQSHRLSCLSRFEDATIICGGDVGRPELRFDGGEVELMVNDLIGAKHVYTPRGMLLANP